MPQPNIYFDVPPKTLRHPLIEQTQEEMLIVCKKYKSTKLTQAELENPSGFYKTPLEVIRFLLKRVILTAGQITKINDFFQYSQ